MNGRLLDELDTQLRELMVNLEWQDKNVPEIARSMFTTLCYISDIEADTKACDTLLIDLYEAWQLKISYEKFENFMLKFIV